MSKNLAKKGRFGDTKLRNVDGELSHVSAFEAYLIDKDIAGGEDFVKKTGLGTINPKTGLKEYAWWMIPAAIAAYGAATEYQDTGNITLGGLWDYSLGNQGLGGYLFGDDGTLESQAKSAVQTGYEGLKATGRSYFKKGGVFDTKTESQNAMSIANQIDARKTYENALSGSGLAFSGGMRNTYDSNLSRLFFEDKQKDMALSNEKTQLSVDLQSQLNKLFTDYASITEEAYDGANEMRTELDSIIGGNYG